MKKHFILLLAALLLLPACAAGAAPDPADLTAAQLLQTMLAVCPEGSGSYQEVDREDVAGEIEGFYGLDPEAFDDGAIVRAGGRSAFELGVVLLTETADPAAAQTALQSYLTARQGDFTGYAPDQAALAAKGQVLTHGRFAAVVISEGAEAAAQAFAGCFDGSVTVAAPAVTEGSDGERYPYTDPHTDDMTITAAAPAVTEGSDGERYPYTDPHTDDMTIYDTSAILAAWDSGDRAALSAKDAAILEAAEGVLDEMLTDGMSDYEKELALYRWLVTSVEYDWAHQDPAQVMDPDSPNPYGALVNRKAICLGYATTFQLFMDLAGVECLTVVGAAFRSSENHAWNMVRLDGDWYCVDATWDMGIPERHWSFLNVTSDYMAQTDHQWDYDAVPEATREWR